MAIEELGRDASVEIQKISTIIETEPYGPVEQPNFLNGVIELETYLQYMGQTMDEYRKGLKTMAETRVKSSLVLEACAKAMNVEATDADVEEEAGKIAEQYGMKKEDFLERIKDNDSFIRESIVGRKTVDILSEKAIRVEPKEEEKKEEEKTEE
jgi:trigger factor